MIQNLKFGLAIRVTIELEMLSYRSVKTKRITKDNWFQPAL